MGDIARLRTESPGRKERVLGDGGHAGRPGGRGGAFAGVTAQRPAQADPGTLPWRASPLRRSALFASKTKTNPIPPPCLSEEGERARRGG